LKKFEQRDIQKNIKSLFINFLVAHEMKNLLLVKKSLFIENIFF